MDPISLGTAAVSLLAPFTPYLVNIATTTTDSLTRIIADQDGEKSWELAQSVWNFLKSKLNQNGETEDAARMLARKPEDQNRQAMLIEVITARLTGNSEALSDLEKLLGGQESIQKITASNESLIENVTQRMIGSGQQVIEASHHSKIRGANQIQEG